MSTLFPARQGATKAPPAQLAGVKKEVQTPAPAPAHGVTIGGHLARLWCSRLAAFTTPEEARLAAEDVYRCKRCGLWHRASELTEGLRLTRKIQPVTAEQEGPREVVTDKVTFFARPKCPCCGRAMEGAK